MDARLFADAGSEEEYPADGLPEVAVLGRSNVGKSSFINALLGRKKLARTSRTPGKTRRVHFYRIDDAMYLVDLPGYGYAAVGREERASWRPMVEAYLRGDRAPLVGAILLVDLRRGCQREEIELLEWLDHEQIPSKLVFTKRDKLKPSQLPRRLAAASAQLEIAEADVAAVSSTRRTGLDLIARWIRAWTGFALQRPDGGDL
jgi:GTP-binding protein